MNYNFDLDLKDGEYWEKLVAQVLKGKIEVKADHCSHRTGNVAVEIECRGRPSGLSTTEARYWMFVLIHERTLITVPTVKLKNLIIGKPTIMGGDDNKSKLVLIKKSELINNPGRNNATR